MSETTLFLGATASGEPIHLLGRMANRHGLVAGATGTGKTVTLQRLAEGFSRMGVPVFTADVKGDLSGLSRPAVPSDKVRERIDTIGLKEFVPRPCPAVFWDVFGRGGHPARTTVTEMGPTLLARLLDLNPTQSDVLTLTFRVADDQGCLLLDSKDLRAMLSWMGDHASSVRQEFGHMAPATLGAIQRAVSALDEAGGDVLFGEPALRLDSVMSRDFSGSGVVSVLDARELFQRPRIYSTFLLWLLSELFEELDEIGDPDVPRLVFFFDEAHLLFKDTPKALVEQIEQVVRLIRSKGVGVYFVTQNPLDLPETILGQLGNRVQHALRAFTPRDQKAVRAAAETFRSNPDLDCEKVITELGVGEALVSVLDDRGAPTPVQRVLIAPPESRIGPLDEAERAEQIARSPVRGQYEAAVDRESAYEILKVRAEKAAAEQERLAQEAAAEKEARQRGPTIVETITRDVTRTVGTQLGRQIVRGILGSLFGGRRRR